MEKLEFIKEFVVLEYRRCMEMDPNTEYKKGYLDALQLMLDEIEREEGA